MLNVYFIKSHQKSSLTWILFEQHKFNKSFNKPTGYGNKLNFIQIDYEITKKMDTEVFDYHSPVTLNEGKGHPNDIKM